MQVNPRSCPLCHGTGTWSVSRLVGRDGYMLAGGPCNHRLKDPHPCK